MQKSKIYQQVLLIVSISLIVCLAFIKIHNFLIKKDIDNTQKKMDEIRVEKQKEIDKKQKEIDSILFDLEKQHERIITLTNKINTIENNNKNLEKELEKRKSEIIKMSNEEIIKYWENEFKN